jgi:hypothetical protein
MYCWALLDELSGIDGVEVEVHMFNIKFAVHSVFACLLFPKDAFFRSNFTCVGQRIQKGFWVNLFQRIFRACNDGSGAGEGLGF